jgi:biotin synthase-like enzyme
MDHTVPETSIAGALDLFEFPLNDLLYRAHTVHRQNFDANHAGANSVFFGERLLTTPNREMESDIRMFERLGLKTG